MPAYTFQIESDGPRLTSNHNGFNYSKNSINDSEVIVPYFLGITKAIVKLKSINIELARQLEAAWEGEQVGYIAHFSLTRLIVETGNSAQLRAYHGFDSRIWFDSVVAVAQTDESSPLEMQLLAKAQCQCESFWARFETQFNNRIFEVSFSKLAQVERALQGNLITALFKEESIKFLITRML